MEQFTLALDFITKLVMTGAFLTLLAVVWKASARFTRLEVTVAGIALNDLPHIRTELQRLGAKLDALCLTWRAEEK